MKNNISVYLTAGFTLIEMMITITVASIIAGMLFSIMGQSVSFQSYIDARIDMDMRISIFNNQLEKDIMGAFVPVQAEEQKKSSAPQNKASAENNKATEEKEDATVHKQDQKPLEKIFFSQHKDGQLKTLSFISNNPLTVYVGEKVGKAKPKIARIQYTIEPEQGHADSFALLRQEGAELEIEPYKDTKKYKAYELLTGIKEISCTFTACIEKQPDEKQAQKPAPMQEQKKATDQKTKNEAPKPPVTYEYKEMQEWSSEQEKSQHGDTTSQESKSTLPRLPCALEIKITVWDVHYKKEKSWVLRYIIPTDMAIGKVKQNENPTPAPRSAPAQPEPQKYKTQEISLTSLDDIVRMFGQMT